MPMTGRLLRPAAATRLVGHADSAPVTGAANPGPDAFCDNAIFGRRGNAGESHDLVILTGDARPTMSTIDPDVGDEVLRTSGRHPARPAPHPDQAPGEMP